MIKNLPSCILIQVSFRCLFFNPFFCSPLHLSKISWLISGEQINYLPWLRQTTDLRNTDRSRYFEKTQFNKCFIIRSLGESHLLWQGRNARCLAVLIQKESTIAPSMIQSGRSSSNSLSFRYNRNTLGQFFYPFARTVLFNLVDISYRSPRCNFSQKCIDTNMLEQNIICSQSLPSDTNAHEQTVICRSRGGLLLNEGRKNASNNKFPLFYC